MATFLPILLGFVKEFLEPLAFDLLSKLFFTPATETINEVQSKDAPSFDVYVQH